MTSSKPGPIAPYLDVESVVQVAKRSGAEAVHPGYGFLSESAAFAAACEAEGIRFIGPRPETIALLGDKVKARQLATESDVPVLKGSPFLGSWAAARQFLQENALPLPIIFKAAFGGGGRGMRLVRQDAELNEAFERCTSEAKTAFGDGSAPAPGGFPKSFRVRRSSWRSSWRTPGTSRCRCWRTARAAARTSSSGTAACSSATRRPPGWP